MLSLKTRLKVSFCSVNLNKPGNIVPKRSLVVSLHAEVSVTTPATGSMSDVNDRRRYKNEAQFIKKRLIFSQNTDYFHLLVLTDKGRRVILNPQQQKKNKKSCFPTNYLITHPVEVMLPCWFFPGETEQSLQFLWVWRNTSDNIGPVCVFRSDELLLFPADNIRCYLLRRTTNTRGARG